MADTDAPKKIKSCFVALAGRPNVGKSTLLNQLVGKKIAITSPRPQTTRNRIVGILNRPGLQVVFLDTPGVMKQKSGLNRYMTKVSVATGVEADILLFMTDVFKPGGDADKFALACFAKGTNRRYLVINKIDAVPKNRVMTAIGELTEVLGSFDEVIPLSAKTGENVDTLLDLIEAVAPVGPEFYPDDMVTDQPERFFIAEIIREKTFIYLREELPYATAVVTEDVVDRDDGLTAILATIYVERKTQKGIMIGKKGAMLKKIGQAARLELEGRFGVKVYLELNVKVREKWTTDSKSLDAFGYTNRDHF